MPHFPVLVQGVFCVCFSLAVGSRELESEMSCCGLWKYWVQVVETPLTLIPKSLSVGSLDIRLSLSLNLSLFSQ